jgi:hypothetical protein
MGLKDYSLWAMGQLDSTCRAPPRGARTARGAPGGKGGSRAEHCEALKVFLLLVLRFEGHLRKLGLGLWVCGFWIRSGHRARRQGTALLCFALTRLQLGACKRVRVCAQQAELLYHPPAPPSAPPFATRRAARVEALQVESS